MKIPMYSWLDVICSLKEDLNVEELACAIASLDTINVAASLQTELDHYLAANCASRLDDS
jgi:hypothetical protein